MSQDPTLHGFPGIARLFPLPNLVMFPGVIQPLHIFEPRYRELLADALADDQLIGMALLQPGWEEDYHKRPPIHPVVCLGRILREERLPDGRYNLLLRGLVRARIIQELEPAKLYRSAQVTLLEDIPVPEAAAERSLRNSLDEVMRRLFTDQPATLEQLGQLQKGELSLGHLTDIFTFALPLDVEIKQQLLTETDVTRRTRLLLDELAGCDPEPNLAAPPQPGKRFPPEFSDN